MPSQIQSVHVHIMLCAPREPTKVTAEIFFLYLKSKPRC